MVGRKSQSENERASELMSFDFYLHSHFVTRSKNSWCLRAFAPLCFQHFVSKNNPVDVCVITLIINEDDVEGVDYLKKN